MATLETLRAKWNKRARQRKRQKDLYRQTGEEGHRKAFRSAGRAMRKLRHLIDNRPLRERALAEAEKELGVMEEGGNNVGEQVEEIIREAGGLPGQAWCGWFCAAMYKRAGSVLMGWEMGAVRLWVVRGIKILVGPKPGDPVRYVFDHIGMFRRWLRFDATKRQYVPCGRLRATHLEAIEGNTGPTGAVSDSATGGDGVYAKIRERSLVSSFLRVPR